MNRFDRDLGQAIRPLADESLPPEVLDPRLAPERLHRAWLSSSLAAGAVALVVVTAIAATQLGTTAAPPASPSPLSSSPVTASVEEDEILLTLRLDRPSSAFGERVVGTITIENVGSGTVYWPSSGGCPEPGNISVELDEPAPFDTGRADWPPDLASLKLETIADDGPSSDHRYPFVSEDQFEHGPGVCWTNLIINSLPEGGTLVHRATWDTVAAFGLPPAPGRYTVETGFSYLSRGAPPVGATADLLKRIDLSMPWEVEGPTVDYLSPGEAMDQLLADATLLELLEPVVPERWFESAITFGEERWTFELTVAVAPDSHVVTGSIRATIDARTGDVTDVHWVEVGG
jgi:hypothetical protein